MLDSYWLSYLKKYDRLFVGFSGGLDSTVLLYSLFAEQYFRSKIIALHINHNLSDRSYFWEDHCRQFCYNKKILFISKNIYFTKLSNVEQIARRIRYSIYLSILGKNDAILLGHHKNDQVETLLLHLFRGSGICGLSAMHPVRSLKLGYVVRPFLKYESYILRQYADENNLNWIDDDSNHNNVFSRNFLRNKVIPLITLRWPGIVNNLFRLASNCLDASNNLFDLARIDCPEILNCRYKNFSHIPIKNLIKLSIERIKNVLYFWFKNLGILIPNSKIFNIIASNLKNAENTTNVKVNWKNICIRSYKQNLYILFDEFNYYCKLNMVVYWINFPSPLFLGKSLGTLNVINTKYGLFIPKGSKIFIKFRSGGERIRWRKQNKTLKKLFQYWNVPPWLRFRIPLLYIDNVLACVIGYAISDDFYCISEENSSYWFKLKNN
ncbi:tRNA lysidine(34) synthetase TilS [Candidatus Legionella polyplacis]|uniref:tRNA(Ile)-lysidine synthase n=1 Tax=Candidatus Legionella polyplacis TaxID=2005262 RepID=A0ABZ2GX28_9GAMM